MPKAKQVLAYDLETTGYSANKNHILEISALIWTGSEPVQCWSTLVKPPVAIPKHITELTGIDAAVLASEGYMALSDAVEHLRGLITPDTLLVSHNGIAFDNPFLAKAGLKLDGRMCWDTLLQMRADIKRKRGRTWKMTQDKAKTYRTKEKTNLLAATKYYGVSTPVEMHRAEADSLATLEIFKKQLRKNKWAIWKQ